MKKIKAVALVLIVILCGAAFTRVMQVEAKANAVQEKLSGEVFRFHVLANSDSKEDQKLKMKVKEAVVDYMRENLSGAGNAAEAKAWAIRHKEELIRVSEEVLRAEGCSDKVTAEVVRCELDLRGYYFPGRLVRCTSHQDRQGTGAQLVVCSLSESLFYGFCPCNCSQRREGRAAECADG